MNLPDIESYTTALTEQLSKLTTDELRKVHQAHLSDVQYQVEEGLKMTREQLLEILPDRIIANSISVNSVESRKAFLKKLCSIEGSENPLEIVENMQREMLSITTNLLGKTLESKTGRIKVIELSEKSHIDPDFLINLKKHSQYCQEEPSKLISGGNEASKHLLYEDTELDREKPYFIFLFAVHGNTSDDEIGDDEEIIWRKVISDAQEHLAISVHVFPIKDRKTMMGGAAIFDYGRSPESQKFSSIGLISVMVDDQFNVVSQ